MNYSDMGIKEVIGIYPKIGELLAAYGVDCAGCSVGTCLMKDVLTIHNYSEDQKRVINDQMESIINHREIDLAAIKPFETEAAKLKFSSPIQTLVDEHKNILRLIDLAQYIIRKKTLTADLIEVTNSIIYYVRNYADKFHHAKEENILFKKTSENQDMIGVFLTEHDMGRKFIANASSGIESGDETKVKENISSYIDLLREHIHKEDKILYPWFERKLAGSGIEELGKEFDEVSRHLDANLEGALVKFLEDNYA